MVDNVSYELQINSDSTMINHAIQVHMSQSILQMATNVMCMKENHLIMLVSLRSHNKQSIDSLS